MTFDKFYLHLISKKNFFFYSYQNKILVKIKDSVKFYYIPLNFISKAIIKFNLLARLFRLQVKHIIPFDESKYLIFAFKKIWLLNIRTSKIIFIKELKGSYPLGVGKNKKKIIYGDYISSKGKKKISLYSTTDGKKWNIILSINFSRHIHGVYYDKYSRSFFVTTGDSKKESGIFVIKNNKLVPYTNNQFYYRVVQLLFCKHFIFFATDYPNKQNYIYRINRITKKNEKIYKISGPCLFGTKLNKTLFFSTSVENGKFEKNLCNVYISEDKQFKKWKIIRSFKKDIYNKKLFQYGTVSFPYIENKNQKYIFCNLHSLQEKKKHLKICINK